DMSDDRYIVQKIYLSRGEFPESVEAKKAGGHMPRRPPIEIAKVDRRPEPLERVSPGYLSRPVQSRGQPHQRQEFGAISERIGTPSAIGDVHDPVVAEAGNRIPAAQLLAEGRDGNRETDVLPRRIEGGNGVRFGDGGFDQPARIAVRRL